MKTEVSFHLTVLLRILHYGEESDLATYSDALRDMLKELYTSSDHADVSLITEDRKILKAHKHILSYCSPVFRDILSITNEQCPLIYLRGIQKSEMESILQFMYLGEASFFQDRMNEFLLVANNLQIKELHKNIEVDNGGEKNLNEPETATPDGELHDTENADERTSHGTRNNDLNKSQVSKDPVPIFGGQSLIQSREGRRGTCEPCGKYYADLSQHVKVKHSNLRYECEHCQHQSSTPANLRIHVESKHEGTKYPCDQCEYTAGTKMGVKFHKDFKHLGIRYSCNECEMKFTQKHDLKRHQERVHRYL